MEWIAVIVLILLAGGAGLYGGQALHKRFSKKEEYDAKGEAERLLAEANKRVQAQEKDAELRIKEKRLQAQIELEKETKEKTRELQNLEKRLLQKEENAEKKVTVVDAKEVELNHRERHLVIKEKAAQGLEAKYGELVQEWKDRLERLAGMSTQEAKARLIESMESEAKHEAAKMVKAVFDEAATKADKEAKKLIALAIQRLAGDFVSERTVSVVPLPTDEMKGRIIGREGRNIRALEAATGVDFIVDDTPEAVILSAHNPVRREVARITLERLIADGRIHPGRIEELVAKVTEEVETSIQQAGEQATFDVAVHGIHPELVKLLGRLKFRTSFAQNVLQHSCEVAWISGILAAELGQNVKLAKRAGLLHDIGKAVDHEVEGSHASIGQELLRKYGEAQKVIHAVAAHHDEVPDHTVLSIIVQAADALSGARPGARREMLETYVKRLEDLERIAKSFNGIEKTFAIQAGREIRIIVESNQVSDEDAVVMSRDMAKRIETELTYPGQIKVTVIREMRAVEYAR
jgi:ribonuclease Y